MYSYSIMKKKTEKTKNVDTETHKHGKKLSKKKKKKSLEKEASFTDRDIFCCLQLKLFEDIFCEFCTALFILPSEVMQYSEKTCLVTSIGMENNLPVHYF